MYDNGIEPPMDRWADMDGEDRANLAVFIFITVAGGLTCGGILGHAISGLVIYCIG